MITATKKRRVSKAGIGLLRWSLRVYCYGEGFVKVLMQGYGSITNDLPPVILTVSTLTLKDILEIPGGPP